MKDHYDCLVVGGGPAGATTAALAAQSGYATLLIECANPPRSRRSGLLMPETCATLRRLRLFDPSNDGPPNESFAPVDFDRLLFDHAAAQGADCCDQAQVLDLIVEGPRILGARLQTAGGACRDVRCRVLVEAAGRKAFLASRLGLPDADPPRRKAAIWGHYRGARRDAGEPAGGVAVLPTCVEDSWFWFIPLSDDITSIGVLGDSADLLHSRRPAAEAFEDELVKRPALAERLMNAELVSQSHIAQEFLYTLPRAGEGWLLLGDAHDLHDPLAPLGVFLSMKCGELAADALVDGFARNDLSARQLERAFGAPRFTAAL